MSKKCERCHTAYRGFGAICSECRRAPEAGGQQGSSAMGSIAAADSCKVCGKRVYVMERSIHEGLLFHQACFCCHTCGRKLNHDYGKNELGFFCLVHYKQLSSVTCHYHTGTGMKARAASTSSIVADMCRHGAASTASSTQEVENSVALASPSPSSPMEAASPDMSDWAVADTWRTPSLKRDSRSALSPAAEPAAQVGSAPRADDAPSAGGLAERTPVMTPVKRAPSIGYVWSPQAEAARQDAAAVARFTVENDAPAQVVVKQGEQLASVGGTDGQEETSQVGGGEAGTGGEFLGTQSVELVDVMKVPDIEDMVSLEEITSLGYEKETGAVFGTDGEILHAQLAELVDVVTVARSDPTLGESVSLDEVSSLGCEEDLGTTQVVKVVEVVDASETSAAPGAVASLEAASALNCEKEDSRESVALGDCEAVAKDSRGFVALGDCEAQVSELDVVMVAELNTVSGKTVSLEEDPSLPPDTPGDAEVDARGPGDIENDATDASEIPTIESAGAGATLAALVVEGGRELEREEALER